jgi:hypothetical protein
VNQDQIDLYYKDSSEFVWEHLNGWGIEFVIILSSEMNAGLLDVSCCVIYYPLRKSYRHRNDEIGELSELKEFSSNEVYLS